MRVLLDTNLIVDVLQQHEPWCKSGKALFLAIANQQITGCITAKEAADIHFFSRKQFSNEENVDEKARQVLAKLFTLFEVVDTLAEDCKNALAFPNNDYEDAIMIESVKREHIDCIITRNAEHFKLSPIKVYTPDEFIALINNNSYL